MLRPASRQMSMRRVAPWASVSPQARKKSLPPPNVPVPRLNTGTLNPDPPSCLNSIVMLSLGLWSRVQPRTRYRCLRLYAGKTTPGRQLKVQGWKSRIASDDDHDADV